MSAGCWIGIAATLLLGASAAGGDEPPPSLAPGALVRVTWRRVPPFPTSGNAQQIWAWRQSRHAAAREEVTGAIVSVDDQSLMVKPGADGAAVRIEWSDVQEVHFSRDQGHGWELVPWRPHPDTRPVVVGDRIHVIWLQPEGSVKAAGNLIAVDEDSLSLETKPAGEPIRVGWSSIRELRVSGGKRRSAAAMASLGVVFGLGAGVALAIGCSDVCDSDGAAWKLSTAVLVGAGTGVLLGSAFRAEQWEPASAPARQPRLSLGVTPLARGGAVAVSLRF